MMSAIESMGKCVRVSHGLEDPKDGHFYGRDADTMSNVIGLTLLALLLTEKLCVSTISRSNTNPLCMK